MISVKNLRVVRGKNKLAVDNVSFSVSRGEVFGLLGHNGSGKSTLLKSILGLIPIEGGASYWDEMLIGPSHYSRIGYVPEERALYPQLSVEENVRFFAKLKGVKARYLSEHVDRWSGRFEIKSLLKKRAYDLSKGQCQRIQLLTALLHQPQLLILDEPFSGLDVIAASNLAELIAELREQGTTIILSTHQIEQAEALCSSICLLREGRSLYTGSREGVQGEQANVDAVWIADSGKRESLHLSSLDMDEARRISLDLFTRKTMLSLGMAPVPLKEIYEQFYREKRDLL